MRGRTTGHAPAGGANRQSRLETSIVGTMQRYFRDNRGQMGRQELSILDSVMRYFEGPAVKATPVRR